MTANDVYDNILSFFDRCRYCYCYGNGHYARAVTHFLNESGRFFAGIVVTSKDQNSEEVIEWKELEKTIEKADGIVFAMSQNNVASLNIDNIKSLTSCLLLRNWELDEVEKYEYYKVVENKPRIGEIYYQKERMLNALHRSMRRSLLTNKGLDEWHIYPRRQKPYCSDIVKYIRDKSKSVEKDSIVELGCGLCDIIGDRRLKTFERYGYDIDKAVISEAKLHHKDVCLECGSFDNVGIGKKISFLITINFLHLIPKEKLKNSLKRVLSDNQVDCYIADDVTGNYLHKFSIEEVVPDNYILENTIGVYPSDGGVRRVKAFCRK